MELFRKVKTSWNWMLKLETRKLKYYNPKPLSELKTLTQEHYVKTQMACNNVHSAIEIVSNNLSRQTRKL